MALARLGTTRDWTDICTDLRLPPSYANRISGLIQHSRRTATWPAVLAALEQLMTGLQQHPPPVDYQDRRTLGDDLHLITDAVLAGQRRHPSPVPVQTLICQFWERFTGGDIAYAPTQIQIDPATPAYTAFRRQSGVANADLFHVAHRHLTRTAAVEGPLTWRPRLLPPAGPDCIITAKRPSPGGLEAG